jgi:hypothetical protein
LWADSTDLGKRPFWISHMRRCGVLSFGITPDAEPTPPLAEGNVARGLCNRRNAVQYGSDAIKILQSVRSNPIFGSTSTVLD